MNTRQFIILFFCIYAIVIILVSIFWIPIGIISFFFLGPFLFFPLTILCINAKTNKDSSLLSRFIYQYFLFFIFPNREYNHLIGGIIFFGLGFFTMFIPYFFTIEMLKDMEPNSFNFLKLCFLGVVTVFMDIILGTYVFKKFPQVNNPR